MSADRGQDYLGLLPLRNRARSKSLEQKMWATLYERCLSLTQEEISQTLGQALGYPWFCDDQKNFPGATQADGVCVGDHVAETLASEAADRIRILELENTSLKLQLAGSAQSLSS